MKEREDMTLEEKLNLWSRNALLNREGTILENWRTKVVEARIFAGGSWDVIFTEVDIYLPRKRKPAYHWVLYMNATRRVVDFERSCFTALDKKGEVTVCHCGSRWFANADYGELVKVLNF